MIELLEGRIREYDWGSPREIPQLLGLPESGRPVAELWLGAHPSAPALVGSAHEPLDSLIARDPAAALGAEAAQRFGSLPFMLKVLAAAAPLSLQAHPSTAQAEAGYAHEEAGGVPIDAMERSFRDRHHKPELICALTEFHTLCGFRDPLASLAVLETVDTPVLDPLRDMLLEAPVPATLLALLEWLLGLPSTDAGPLVDAVVAACASDGPNEGAAERHVCVELGSRYPGDPGVVVSLLLNHVVLSPNEALFLGAGNLHAYLRGTGVEIMANSDNVVRGGLTSKHVDVPTLLEIVDPTPVVPVVQRPAVIEGVARYDAPAPEFSLRRLELAAGPASVEGPAVLLCTAGTADLHPQVLARGDAAWLPAADGAVTLDGDGTVFVAGLGPH